MTKRFREILIVSSALLASWAAAAAMPEGEPSGLIRVESFKTHSRLSFHVDEGVRSELKTTPQGFDLELKGVGLADLGAPLGEEGPWAARFKSIQDPRLAGMDFVEVPGGLRISGQWKYAQGPEAPANPVMESFDYRERARSELVIDFWVKEGPTVQQVKARRAVTRRIASVKKHEEDEKARAARRLALERARAEAEDPKLFCRTPLSERSDVFLQFLPVHEPVAFTRWFLTLAPDSDYAYYEPKGKSQDAQYVRLALKLYREGNFALANRTIDFFDQECPGSAYRPEMRFLRANAFLKLGMGEEGNQILKEIQRENKSSTVAMHAAIYTAIKQLEAKNHLGALETFSWLADNHAESANAWVFHLGAAECARSLKQTDRAVKEYQWVAEHAPDAASQAEGAFRIGDLYLDRFQYDQGLAAYAQAKRHFPSEAGSFPPLHVNRADSLYGLGQFDRAAEAYRDFLKRFPSHPAGWRASYRLGELAARRAGSSRQAEDAQNWYFETINRYPFSPGALLARLQLLPCGEHGGFTPEAAERFFAQDAERFEGDGEVAMDRFKDFRALSRVRSLMTLGRQEEAVATAIDELRRVPRAEARRWLGHLLVFNFRKAVLELLDSGQGLGALTFYQKNVDTVPVTDGAVDPGYLLKLSQAASDLGLGKLAEAIGVVFEKARKSRETAIRELASEGQKGAADSSDEADRKLAASERAFTEAKAIWIGSGMKQAAEVRARLEAVVPESRFSYERELILGLIDERSGDPKSALRHAAQAQLLAARDPRVDAWVAALEAQVGDAKAALAAFRALEARVAHVPGAKEGSGEAGAKLKPAELLGVSPVPAREALILAQSEILEREGRWGEAAANYARAVDKGLGGPEARYNYARALLKAGGRDNRAKAMATLEKLVAEDKPASAKPSARAAAAGPSREARAGAETAAGVGAGAAAEATNKFWRKLASETLADENAKNSAKEGIKQ